MKPQPMLETGKDWATVFERRKEEIDQDKGRAERRRVGIAPEYDDGSGGDDRLGVHDCRFGGFDDPNHPFLLVRRADARPSHLV